MAASVLNSPKAVQMSVFVVRAFVELRNQFAMRDVLSKRLEMIEHKLLCHDTTLQNIYKEIQALRGITESKDRSPIGFRLDSEQT